MESKGFSRTSPVEQTEKPLSKEALDLAELARLEQELTETEAELARIEAQIAEAAKVKAQAIEVHTPKIAPIIVAQEGPLAIPKAPVVEPEVIPLQPTPPTPTIHRRERAPVFTKDRIRKAIKTAALTASLTLIPKAGQKDPVREHAPRTTAAKEASTIKRNPDTALFLSEHLKQSTDTTATVSHGGTPALETRDTVATTKEIPTAVEKKPEGLFPEHFGTLESRMNMEFFTKELKTPAAKLAYLEWIREVTDRPDRTHPYMPMIDKERAVITIVDKAGNPVEGMHGKPLILGRDRHDGTEMGQTPAGFFWIEKSTNPVLLKEHPNLFEIRVPSDDGQSLEIDIHDTLYTLHSSVQSSVLNEKTKTAKAPARRLSGGCLRIAGLDQGIYNRYFDAVTLKYKDRFSGKEAVGRALPKIAILPEEKAPNGTYSVLDRRSGKIENLTEKQIQQKVQEIISGKSLTK